jgi:Ner family transcriptional regulator
MTKVDTAKKPALTDWHPADVIASIRKSGTSIRQLSIKHGYHARSLQRVLVVHWRKAERIIANALGLEPSQIWPSRHHADGRPKNVRGERGIGRPRRKDSTRRAARNGHRGAAA